MIDKQVYSLLLFTLIVGSCIGGFYVALNSLENWHPRNRKELKKKFKLMRYCLYAIYAGIGILVIGALYFLK